MQQTRGMPTSNTSSELDFGTVCVCVCVCVRARMCHCQSRAVKLSMDLYHKDNFCFCLLSARPVLYFLCAQQVPVHGPPLQLACSRSCAYLKTPFAFFYSLLTLIYFLCVRLDRCLSMAHRYSSPAAGIPGEKDLAYQYADK